MPLKFAPPGLMTLDQIIEQAIKEHLGIDKNHPDFKNIKKELMTDLIPSLIKCPALLYNQKALFALMPIFLNRLRPQRKITPTKEFSRLKLDCMTFLKKLEKKDPALAKRLEEILNKNAPKLNSNDPKEVAHALRLIITMYILLKKDNPTLLKQFADAPDEMDLDRVLIEEIEEARKLLLEQLKETRHEGLLTEVQMANLLAFGQEMETGKSLEAPLAEVLGMILTAPVMAALEAVSPTIEPQPELPTKSRSPFEITPKPPWEKT